MAERSEARVLTSLCPLRPARQLEAADLLSAILGKSHEVDTMYMRSRVQQRVYIATYDAALPCWLVCAHTGRYADCRRCSEAAVQHCRWRGMREKSLPFSGFAFQG